MKKSFLKVLSVMLAIVLSVSCLPIGAAAATRTGNLGGNVKWSYDSKTKTITVSGSGNMKNFSKANDGQGFNNIVIGTTQYPNKDATKIVISEGVTNIGNNAFRSLTGIKNVTVPSSVTSIGQSAFEGCTSLNSVNFTSKLTSIGAYAFKNTKLASVDMPYTVKSIGDYAFTGISGFKMTCFYGDTGYNYCVKHNAAYTFRQISPVLSASLDETTKQLNLTFKIKNPVGLNAANFTITYNDAVIPASSQAVSNGFSSESVTSTAVVFNEQGRISVAVFATDDIKHEQCASASGLDVEYTIVTIAFKVNGQADKATFAVSSDTFMLGNSKFSIPGGSTNADLHKYNEKVTKTATCIEAGEKTITCVLCGKTTTETIAKNTANHVGGTEIKNKADATCTKEGNSGDTVCKGCGAIITKGASIPKIAHNYTSVKTDPTCTQDGFTTYKCKACGNSYVDNKVAAPGHDYDVKVTKTPTCSEEGEKTLTCKVCNNVTTEAIEKDAANHVGGTEIKNKADATCTTEGNSGDTVCKGCGATITKGTSIPKINHSYVIVVIAPTCTQDGFTAHTCSVCGDSYTEDTVAALGHDYDAEITKTPTCSEEGEKTLTCKVCNDVTTETIEKDAVNHVGGTEIKNAAAATCTEEGNSGDTVCKGCGATITNGTSIPKIDHNYEAVVTEPTCTQDGFTAHTCSVCGDSYTEDTVAALGHNYENGVCTRCGNTAADDHEHEYEAVVTDPTCTQDGFTTYTCSICGNTYVADTVAALGHDYDEEITKTPTCNEEGEKILTCKVCNDVTTAAIAKDASNHVGGTEIKNKADATCAKEGNLGDTVCKGCGAILKKGESIAKTAHSYETSATAPTCTKDGFTTYTCKACGNTYNSDKVAALGHKYEEKITKTPTCHTTGEKTLTCSVCKDVKTENLAKDAANHDGGTEIKNAVAATCTKEGKSGDTVCKGCKAVLKKSESIPKINHDYTTVKTDATCTQDGFTTYTCSVCGDFYVGDKVSALGHNYVNGVCTRCDDVSVVKLEFKEDSKAQTNDEAKSGIIKTTVNAAQLKDMIATEGWEVLDSDGNAIADDQAVPTGATLKHTATGTVYVVIIFGDVNADGTITASDAREALRVSAKLSSFDAVQEMAAKVTGNEKLSAADARTILRVSAKLETF